MTPPRAIPKPRANADTVPNRPDRTLHRTEFSEDESSPVQPGRPRNRIVALPRRRVCGVRSGYHARPCHGADAPAAYKPRADG